ncbi:MAG: hypothetical protein U0X87_13510 [Anaerolineales bacterium]
MQAPSGLSGVEASEVDEGDYLLDWRSGGEGLRYVHHFTEAELGKLASASGSESSNLFIRWRKRGIWGCIRCGRSPADKIYLVLRPFFDIHSQSELCGMV